MVPDTFNIIDRFITDIFQEGIIAGIHAAGKHEILPD